MSKMCYPKEIIDSKFVNNKCYYLVLWKGFKEPTWEPACNIEHRIDLIGDYRDMLMISHLGMNSGGYIYCRVSSKEQSKYNEGHTSLNVQETEIRKFCEQKQIKVIKVIHEVYSARNMDKLRGLQYLCDIAAPGQNIYVYDISRFSRNIHHALNILEKLNDNKISVVSVTENITYNTPASRNQFRLQLCASTYYSDMCSQKVRASIEYRRSRGDYIGRTPFGYTTQVDNKTYIRKKVICQNEMLIIKLIKDMNNTKSLREILNFLKKRKIMFRKKKPTISGIKRIIRRFSTDLVHI